MKLQESYRDFLSEFTDDGSAFLLAAGSNWHEEWKEVITLDGLVVIKVTGGWTSTEQNLFIAVVNVEVDPKFSEGAEDKARETMTVYFKEWSNSEDAKKDILDRKGKIKLG
jgi:hypothetical protein